MAEENERQSPESENNYQPGNNYQKEPEYQEEENSFLKRFWYNLRPPARIGIIAVAGLAFVAILILSVTSSISEQKEVLYHRLDPSDAREIAAALDEDNIPYELEDDGTTILVPPDQRDRLRINLSPDLHAQGIGFELFEEGAMVASDFERQAQWQIALEEELRRTIASLDAVDQARVHLVITDDGVFIRDREDPSASVFLRLSPLTTLSEDQVRGIVSLVSGSVEGLKPENVSVVDEGGNVLHDAFAPIDNDVVTSTIEEQHQLKRQFETELESRLRSILEQVYGPGRAVAMVSAEMDFDSREQTMVAYENDPVPRSTHRIEEQSESMGAPVEEVGEANIPGQAAALAGEGESSYEHIEEIVNYEVGETREYIETAPGQVVNLSTAVIIDNDGGDPFMDEQIAELVDSAVGLDEARGDTLSVQMIPFAPPDVPEPVPAEPPVALPLPLPWLIAIAAAALLALLALILFLRARARRRREEEEYEMDPLSLEDQMEGRVREETEEETGEAEKKAKLIRDMAKEEPESVANLLKTWLTEE